MREAGDVLEAFSFLPLLQRHDRWALVLEDSFIGVDADVQLVAQLAGLDDGAGMSCQP